MKVLTAKYFIYIFMKAFPKSKTVKGRLITAVKKKFSNNGIRCDLSLEDFMEMESVYPDYVRVKDDGIRINPSRDFRESLDSALVFSKDKELEHSLMEVFSENT